MANIELATHQINAVRELHNGAVLRGGVGTGKTRVALAYWFIKICEGRVPINGKGDFKPMEKPKHIYVITTAKKRDSLDWQKEAAHFGITDHQETWNVDSELIIDSWNNITDYVDVKNAFFVFDEQRLVGAGAWVKAFLKIAKNNQWIMLSATPGDNWMDFLPIFLANGFYKNRTEFTRRHVKYRPFTKFAQIEGYLETGTLEKLRKKILVEMPYLSHTIRHVFNMIVDYDKEQFDIIVKKRWNIFKNKPLKDAAEMFIAMRRLVNTDISRYAAIMKLMEKHPKLIIFYNFDYELEMLRILSLSTMMHKAEWNGHKHEDVPVSESWLYFVQYTAGAEGWNCIETDAMAFWSLNYSYKLFEQSKGRTDRFNTPFTDLYYYVLRSMSPIDNGIWKALGDKTNFNERSFDLAA